MFSLNLLLDICLLLLSICLFLLKFPGFLTEEIGCLLDVHISGGILCFLHCLLILSIIPAHSRIFIFDFKSFFLGMLLLKLINGLLLWVFVLLIFFDEFGSSFDCLWFLVIKL
jgi:hypothetical protein